MKLNSWQKKIDKEKRNTSIYSSTPTCTKEEVQLFNGGKQFNVVSEKPELMLIRFVNLKAAYWMSSILQRNLRISKTFTLLDSANAYNA